MYNTATAQYRCTVLVISHLLVGGVWAHESQLDRVEGVGGQDLREEAGVDHRGLGKGSTLCNINIIDQSRFKQKVDN